MQEAKDEIEKRWQRVREITEMLGKGYKNKDGHGTRKEAKGE